MGRLSLSMLGPMQVTLDARAVTAFESNRVRALLAYLVLEPERPHHRDQLAGLLWPEWPDRSARSNLRYSLANLRTAIGDREAEPPFLSIGRETLQFNAASDHWLDVRAFLNAIEESKSHAHRDLSACAVCARRLQEVVELYKGELLAGFSLDSAPFEEWLVVRRETLHRQALDALYHLGAYHCGRGDYERAIHYAQRQVELEPWSERAHRQWMRALALNGQRGAAVAQYEACRRVLQEELGIEPGPEIKALYQRIRDGSPSPVVVPVAVHSLPVPLTPLVGREQLLDEIQGYLADPACRLLNLVGPGGSGKTRLALAVAMRLAQANAFRDGVYFVPLAALQSVDGLVPAIAHALGLSLSQGPSALARSIAQSPTQQLCAYFREKHLLLALDNFEHLIAGANLVSELLLAAPEVRVLVTSRSRLNLRGESLFHVTGLAYPEVGPSTGAVEDLLEYGAVQLFVQSAERIRSGTRWTTNELRSVGDICRLVHGMPLGILLAAGWVEALSPAEIAARISGEMEGQGPDQGLGFLETAWSDVPERQRSMRAVFDHSWNLLSEREQQNLSGLSVFRGSFAYDAARQVTGATLRELLALINRSIVHRTPKGRYEIHELLRQYAAEQLAASPGGEHVVRDRHAAHYVAALERWEGDLKGPRQLAALAEIEADVENARAAWNWAVDSGQVGHQDQALDALCLFYERRGRYEEGSAVCQRTCERLARSMSASGGAGELGVGRLAFAKAAAWRATFGRIQGETELADRLYAQSMAVLDDPELNDPDTQRARAFALRRMAQKSLNDDLNQARRLGERSLGLYQAVGDRWGASAALYDLGQVAFLLGTPDEAVHHTQESLTIRRSLGDHRGIALALWLLGITLVNLGDLVEAERHARECIDVARQTADEMLVTDARMLLNTVFHDSGQYEQARIGREEELAFYRARGNHHRLARILNAFAFTNLHLARYPEAKALAREGVSLSRESGLLLFAARCSEVLGRVALAEGACDVAEARFQESIDLYRRMGSAIPLSDAFVESAYVARAVGDRERARERLRTGLRMGANSGRRNIALLALPVVALLLADGAGGLGQRGLGQPDIERAVELYALASCYPYVANSRWFEDVAGREISAAAETLPSEIVAAAQERSRARDLWDTAEELLGELEGPES